MSCFKCCPFRNIIISIEFRCFNFSSRAYYNESLIKLDKNMKPKPFILLGKILSSKKIKFTILKKGIKWQDGNSLKLMTGFIL